MKVLVIGAKGSIGRRYCAILKHIGVKYEVWEYPKTPRLLLETYEGSVDMAIVASPTDTHGEYCGALMDMDMPFLCEKPLSKNIDVCMSLARKQKMYGLTKCNVVNNYWFLFNKLAPMKSIYYDYYNTGRDGIEWDLCQLIAYADERGLSFDYDTSSPIWTLKVDGAIVPYDRLEQSYIDMVYSWLHQQGDLLDLTDGLDMSLAVREYKIEHLNRHTSAKR